jgi:uncharacterized membrane protein
VSDSNEFVEVLDAPPAPRSPEQLAGLKNLTTVVYALQALSFLWGVTAVVGMVLNHLKRDDVRGTLYQSHFDWQIRTFWWGLLWSVVGVATIWLLVGFAVLFAVWVWSIYRIVKGWLRLNEGRPVLPA